MQPISLVILAAGLGSRYGGQKQTDGLGPNQESLLDYAIYDGLTAGFTQIVFVVRESMMPSFKEALEARWGSYRNKYYPKACFECVLQKMDVAMMADKIIKPAVVHRPIATKCFSLEWGRIKRL